MPVLSIAAIIQWITLGQQVFERGSAVWAQIQGVLKANGIEADTSELDKVIIDAERRKAIAEAEAEG
jgi:hypothetical protein